MSELKECHTCRHNNISTSHLPCSICEKDGISLWSKNPLPPAAGPWRTDFENMPMDKPILVLLQETELDGELMEDAKPFPSFVHWALDAWLDDASYNVEDVFKIIKWAEVNCE